MNSLSLLQLEERQADGMSNGGYRLVPESLRQQEDITLSQALFLSLFLFGKNQTRTNKELSSLYDPSKDTSTQVPQIFIRKLVDKGYLTVYGKGKARKVMPTLKALKFATGKQLYLVVHQDIMQAPVSGSRKMFHAAQRKLDRAGATGLAKTLGLQKVTAYYHMAKIKKQTVDPISQPNMFLDSTQYVFRPYIKIEDNKSIINNSLIIYKKPIDKSIGRGLRPATVAVSGQIFLSGEPMYPDQYNNQSANQCPVKPK